MRIIILQGSPNRRGSTYMLADSFRRGAESAGHSVELIEAAYAGVNPCTGCVHCGYEGPCARRDGMDAIRQKILTADMLVFATPLYYYGMSAQLKVIVDRFCAFNASLTRRHMKSALIAAAWNSDGWTFDALKAHYNTLVRYLGFDDVGMVLGGGCGTPSMTANSIYMRRACELGKNLK